MACALSSLAAVATGVSPAGAADPVEASNTFQGEHDTQVCDVEVDAKVVNLEHVHADGTTVDHRQSPVIPLAKPLPAGRVLTSGVTTDVDHFEDAVDFTGELSQFEEQVTIRFLNSAGAVIAETDPTPDLPDAAPYAPFALPSVDLAEPAVAVQVAHIATGSDPNSVNAPCIDFQRVGPNSAPSDFLQFGPCPIDGFAPLPLEAVCGFLAVPENRDDPATRHINIAFGVVLGDGTKPDPLVYLEGGPGGAPLNAGGLIYDLAIGPASDGRDVIFIDQRGTGYAYPNLNCVQQDDYLAEPEEFASQEEFDAAQTVFLQRCFDRIVASGADVDGYTTVQNGADVADLRIALGLKEWNLFGGSYGTDLALTIMRDRPDGVRSVVLDSVFPPEVNPASGDDMIGFLNRLDAVGEICAADPLCSAANPNVRASIIAAVDHLNAEPILVAGTETEFLFGLPEGVLIDGFTILSILDFDFANPYVAAMVTGLASDDAAVRQATAENFLRNTVFLLLGLPPEIASELKAQYRGVPGPGTEFSDGFFWTVMCAEEFPFPTGATEYTGEPWSDAVYAYVAEGLDFFDFEEQCAIFDVAAEDPVVNQPVVSNLPALILYTDNDIQTAPEWSELTAESLTNSKLVFFNNLGHVVTFYDPCPQNIVAAFLANPGGELDTSCTASLPPIYYEPVMVDIAPLPPIEQLFDQLDELFGGGDGEPVDGDDGQPVAEEEEEEEEEEAPPANAAVVADLRET